jgi:hypothetical protein
MPAPDLLVVDEYRAFSLPCDDDVRCRGSLFVLQGVPRNVEASCLWRDEVYPPSFASLVYCDPVVTLL